jgi:hypothetical protein
VARASFSSDASSIYSEVAAGRIRNIRIGVGTVLANGDDDGTEEETASDEALQRFLSAGGSLGMNAMFPAFYGIDAGRGSVFAWMFSSRIAVDLPADNEASSLSTLESFNADAGTDLVLSIRTSREEIGISGRVRASVVSGTEAFFAGLGDRPFLSSEDGVKFRGGPAFGLVTWTSQLRVGPNASITLAGVMAGPRVLRESPVMIGFQFEQAKPVSKETSRNLSAGTKATTSAPFIPN